MDALTIVFTITIYFIIYSLCKLSYFIDNKIEEIKNNIESNEAIRNNELDSLSQERIENYRTLRELYNIQNLIWRINKMNDDKNCNSQKNEIKEVVFIAKTYTHNNNTLVYARHCKLMLNKDGSVEIIKVGLFKNIHLSIMNDDEYLKFIGDIKCELLFLDTISREHPLLQEYIAFLMRANLLPPAFNLLNGI